MPRGLCGGCLRPCGRANKYCPACRPASKYGNRQEGGLASRREARRLAELRLLEAAGVITGLRTQVPFDLSVNGVKVCRYVADFAYLGGGALKVEDAKGYRTRVYGLKKKLMLAVYGISISEV